MPKKIRVNIFEEMREALHEAASYERCKPVDFALQTKREQNQTLTLKNVGCGTRQALVTRREERPTLSRLRRAGAEDAKEWGTQEFFADGVRHPRITHYKRAPL
jgi:hypothetical protein